MKVDSYSIRGFVANYTDVCSSDIDLDLLVVQYRQNPSSSCYATIYNNILGIVLNFGRRFTVDQGVTPEDVYSYGMLALFKALDPEKGWKSESGVKFITYLYRAIHNEFVTLGQTKSNRNYKKYTISLDELLADTDEYGESKVQLTEEQSNLALHRKFRQPRRLDCVRSLASATYENKFNLCLSLGLPMAKVELAILAAKVKYKQASHEEIEQFNNNKKEYKKVKKYLKKFV